MIELHASVRYFHIRLFRILQGRILVDNLCDTSRARHTHTDHNEYHRKHHQAHQDIHAVCKQTHQVACGKHITHDHMRTDPADQQDAAIHREHHDRHIAGDDALCPHKHVVELRTCLCEFICLILLADVRLNYTDCRYILLHAGI